MDPERPVDITFGQLTLAFVSFAAVIVWALLQPEFGPALDLGRTKLTIWATTFLLTPALVLYLFRSADQRVANLAHLFWLFAWLAFVVHAYWAVFIIFDGVADTFRKMGIPISSVNFLLVGVWTLDVLLLWTLRRPRSWLWKAQLGTRVFAFLTFAVTLVALRGGTVRMLGLAFATIVIAALLLRAWSHVRDDRTQQA
ncbi:hypothetical protein N2605_27100 [Bradyrhizobium yuanmingense]|uniref:hypothetical protein n=1 Tax=Bradyrhizobium yuanmingense TaxID=108015 RepID=UPI0021A5895F|nr:hypothetical protein [Bradyrhizobium sp. CB1024]UWU83188.1 hypothetical protein N2605_27100 [Bradyrhizobium sp. CB1024]